VGARGAAPAYEREDGAALRPLPLGHRRREPEKRLLHQRVCAHLDTLLAERRADDPDGHGLPAYVEQEFRRFIDCGVASRGFVRLFCDRCKQEMVVGFSCKGMGFCPSCLGRRMNDTAAHLVDRVLPFSPYRQWVLSLPFRLRLLLAKEGRLLGKVRTIFMRTVRSWQRLQARRLGLRDVTTAAVCFTQLFGSRLDCSPHFLALAPEAVFLESEEGDLELWRLPQPKREEIERLVERIARRTLATLKEELGEDLRLDALDRLRAGTQQQLSFSAMAEPPEDRVGKLSARCEGFSLQAGRHLHQSDREGLEALLRYCLRPPVAQERLSMAENDSGKVVLKLRRPLADGRAELEMTPVTLLKRFGGPGAPAQEPCDPLLRRVRQPREPAQSDRSTQPESPQALPRCTPAPRPARVATPRAHAGLRRPGGPAAAGQGAGPTSEGARLAVSIETNVRDRNLQL
jgi:Transposase zinc-binding domain/Putative transposase